MKIPRYLQQEQFTDQSTLVPQQQRIVSPLEVVGQGGAGILENIVQQDQQAYLASESARAITKVTEIADDIETNEINAGKILDSKGIGDILKQRVNQAFDDLQLTSKVRRAAQPRVEELMALKSIDLKNSIELQRGKIQAANVENSLEELTKGMTDATTDAELGYYRDLIISTVGSLEGSLVSPEQKNALIQNKFNQVHEARINRMLNTPGADPNDAMQYLESKKGEMTSAAYEAQRTAIENEIQTGQKNEIFYQIDDAIRAAENDSSLNLKSIHELIDAHRDEFNPEAIRSFRREVDGINADRKANSQTQVLAQVERAVNLDKDFDKATEILNQHQGLFDPGEYTRILTKIDVARQNRDEKITLELTQQQQGRILDQVNRARVLDKNYEKAKKILDENKNLLGEEIYQDELFKIDESKTTESQKKNENHLWGNVSIFAGQIERGEFDHLDVYQMKDTITTEAEIKKTLPGQSLQQLLNVFIGHQNRMDDEKIALARVVQDVRNGIKPSDEKSVRKIWDGNQAYQTDAEQFREFVKTYGGWKFQADYIKRLINSKNPEYFAAGIEFGNILQIYANQEYNQLFDEDTRKAILWGADEIRNIDEYDSEMDPQTGERFYSPDKNLRNAQDRIMKRLNPESKFLGIPEESIDKKLVESVSNNLLSSVFYKPSNILARAAWYGTPILPSLETAGKWLGSFAGNPAYMTRQESGFSTYLESIPALPKEARDQFIEMAKNNIRDGMTDYQKAAQLALPRFLDQWGISRIGAIPGTAYWQLMPAEWYIKKNFVGGKGASETAFENAIKIFENDVYETAIDETKDTFYKVNYRGRKSNLQSIPPSIRLLPTKESLKNSSVKMPDYHLYFIDEKTGELVQIYRKDKPNIPYTVNGMDALQKLLRTNGANEQGIQEGRK